MLQWAQIKGYAFPPFCLIDRCLAKAMQESAELVLVTPVWQAQPWYPKLLAISIDSPILLLLRNTKGETHTLIDQNKLCSAAWHISGVPDKQQSFQTRLATSWQVQEGQEHRLLTTAPVGKWHRWHVQGQIDPFCASVTDVINFLAETFQEGLEYSTMSVYRSVLSVYHPEIVGQQPAVRELMCRIFQMRPPQPKYAHTWDVDLVLRYIRELGDNDGLRLKELTLKLAMMLALKSSGKAQKLSCLDPELMADKGPGLVFEVAKLTKCCHTGKLRRKPKFSQFLEDAKIDVVGCVRDYLQVTQEACTTPERQRQQLFSYTKPHDPGVPCPGSRWLREMMSRASIDTSKLKCWAYQLVRSWLGQTGHTWGLSRNSIAGIKLLRWMSFRAKHCSFDQCNMASI